MCGSISIEKMIPQKTRVTTHPLTYERERVGWGEEHALGHWENKSFAMPFKLLYLVWTKLDLSHTKWVGVLAYDKRTESSAELHTDVMSLLGFRLRCLQRTLSGALPLSSWSSRVSLLGSYQKRGEKSQSKSKSHLDLSLFI